VFGDIDRSGSDMTELDASLFEEVKQETNEYHVAALAGYAPRAVRSRDHLEISIG
jgi:hypothetical protein